MDPSPPDFTTYMKHFICANFDFDVCMNFYTIRDHVETLFCHALNGVMNQQITCRSKPLLYRVAKYQKRGFHFDPHVARNYFLNTTEEDSYCGLDDLMITSTQVPTSLKIDDETVWLSDICQKLKQVDSVSVSVCQMVTKVFYVSTSSDYREGFKIYLTTEDDEHDHELTLDFDPTNTHIMYIILVDCEYVEVMYQESVPTKTQAMDLILRGFAQVNDSLPFVTTGMTCAYKEEGHYPPVDDSHRQPLPIDLSDETDADYIYGIILDVQHQEIVHIEPIRPLF